MDDNIQELYQKAIETTVSQARRIAELEAHNQQMTRALEDDIGEKVRLHQRIAELEVNNKKRLSDNNDWWEKRFKYFHRWGKSLPEPYITEFFDIAANGSVAEWRERYKTIQQALVAKPATELQSIAREALIGKGK